MGVVFAIIQVANRFELDKPENVKYYSSYFHTIQALGVEVEI
jgi:hypothetical protein